MSALRLVRPPNIDDRASWARPAVLPEPAPAEDHVEPAAPARNVCICTGTNLRDYRRPSVLSEAMLWRGYGLDDE